MRGMVLSSATSGTVDATGAATEHLAFQNFNLLTGHAGSDTVDGTAAGAGGFRVYTAWGNDLVLGSVGGDQIEGGYGADTINAGAGNDAISMTGDLFSSGPASGDTESDLLVLTDGFGQDTVRAFTIADYQDQWGQTIVRDRLDVSGLHDADGNPLSLNDVTVGTYTLRNGSTHALLSFPNGEVAGAVGRGPRKP